MAGEFGEADRGYLRMAVDLSRGYREDQRRWPFGAVVVVDGQIAGQGVNQVVERHDPAAHAEVMALRAAGAALRTHVFEDGALYSSSEPCPMCLAACYWARLKRVVFAATTTDVADCGLQDLAIYHQVRLPAADRSMQEDHGAEDLRQDASAILRDWAQRRDT
jgi:tRNA(Arg) A34 adenosine deaminase TadA